MISGAEDISATSVFDLSIEEEEGGYTSDHARNNDLRLSVNQSLFKNENESCVLSMSSPIATVNMALLTCDRLNRVRTEKDVLSREAHL